VQTYAGREQSIWTKYLDARKWLTRNAKQVRKLGLVLNPPRDVLDLGCGAGYFLFVLKQLGSGVLGVDLDHDPIFNDMIRLFAIERIDFGITRRVRLREFGGRKFDLITAWMVCFNNYDHKETILDKPRKSDQTGTLRLYVPVRAFLRRLFSCSIRDETGSSTWMAIWFWRPERCRS
jgi:SAM-dependent methyltransferase